MTVQGAGDGLEGGSGPVEDAALAPAVATMMAAHWREGGYTVPNAQVYPWQWLWDSCFHALIWAELGDGERAVAELANALAPQDELGFVKQFLSAEQERRDWIERNEK